MHRFVLVEIEMELCKRWGYMKITRDTSLATDSLNCMMKSMSYHLLAGLLLLGCSSSNDEAAKESAPVAPKVSDIGKRAEAVATEPEAPIAVQQKESGPVYSDELADKLIAEVSSCKVIFMDCDAADQLKKLGSKATGKLIASLTDPAVKIEAVLNLTAIVEAINDPAAAQPLLDAAKPKKGVPLNPLLDTAMKVGDQAFYEKLLAKVNTSGKNDVLAYQILQNARSLCLVRRELAETLFAWAGTQVKGGSERHAGVVEGCAPYVEDKESAKAGVSEMLATIKDKGARIQLANAGFALGDFSKAKVWIDLSKDKVHGGSARIEVITNAKDIPEELKAAAIESVNLSIEMAKKFKLSTNDADKALAELQ